VDTEPRYRFLQKLGEGGMGEVYLAEHLRLGRKEALKVLRADLARDQRFVLRFRREARATHRVQHANIVGVHDFGRLGDGRFYLAMEYVVGRRLDEVLKAESPFPVPRALDLLVQLTGAVAHAHRHGVIHRDLKPANLLLTRDARGAEVVKVLDFGIAKLMFPEPGDATQLTLDGEVFGTPKYMAPELFVAGQTIDHQADIYALGCIAYEILTGQPPFTGRRLEIMDAHLGKAPEPPSARNPAIRPELERLILRCLEKNRRRRLQSAHDLHLAFELMAGNKAGRIGTGQSDDDTGAHENPLDSLQTRADPTRRGTLIDTHGDEARVQLEEATVDAADAILSLGHSGTELVFLLIDLKETTHARDRTIAEQRDVEERIAEAEQRSRQREASLRFALAELAFDREAELSNGSDAARVREIESKLEQAATEHGRLSAALTERAITLAAELARVEERRAAVLATLGEAVDRSLERYSGEPTLAPMRERVLRARSLHR
jgi:serine/threonine protein kinase